MSESRKVKSYLIVEPNLHTHIQSTTPSGAAKKVYSKYIRPILLKQDSEQVKMHFIVKIQNENGKIFEYDVHEVKKNDIVMRGNKEIPYTYNVMVKSKNIHKSEYVKKKSQSKSKSRSKSKSSKKHFIWFRRIKKHNIIQ